MDDSDTNSEKFDDDGTEDYQLLEAADAWIRSQQQHPLMPSIEGTTAGNCRSSEYGQLISASSSISFLQSVYSSIAGLPLGRRHSIQSECQPKAYPNAKITKHGSQSNQHSLSIQEHPKPSMKPSHRYPSFPKSCAQICNIPEPPPRNGSTLAPPPFSTQSSRTSIYTTSDSSSFLYISAKPSIMSKPNPTGLSQIVPVRPAPPPPPIYVEQETQFSNQNPLRPSLYSCAKSLQSDNYSVYSMGSSVSCLNEPFQVNKNNFTRHWLYSVSSKTDQLSVQFPLAYDEIQRFSSNVPTRTFSGVSNTSTQPSKSNLRNFYNYPTVLINGGSGSKTVSLENSMDEEAEAEECENQLITDFYGTRLEKCHSSETGKNTNVTFSTTLSSDMMDPSEEGGIFRKLNDGKTKSKIDLKQRFARLDSNHYYEMDAFTRRTFTSDPHIESQFVSHKPICCQVFLWILCIVVAVLSTISLALGVYYYCSGSESDIITFFEKIISLLIQSIEKYFGKGQLPSTVNTISTSTLATPIAFLEFFANSSAEELSGK